MATRTLLPDAAPLAGFFAAGICRAAAKQAGPLRLSLCVAAALCLGPCEAGEHRLQAGLAARAAAADTAALRWEPPDSSTIIIDEAQWGFPDAPFIFAGGVLQVAGSFTSQRNFQIGEPAVINVHPQAVLHVSGIVDNAGASRAGLVKLGAGVLALSGRNTYSGNTLLLQGGLHIANDHALGTRTLNLNTGTWLRYAPGVALFNALQMEDIDIGSVVAAGSYEMVAPADYEEAVQLRVDEGEAIQAGVLAGAAPFVKVGAGRLRLAGPVMPYSGRAVVDQGALAVDAMLPAPVQVNRGGRLEGIGQVAAVDVLAGGTLAPGNSIGRFIVNGDLALRPGSLLEIDAAADGAADFVQVNGRASLDGHMAVVAQAGDWRINTRYLVLRAEQGLHDSRFASVAASFAFLAPTLDYDDRHVYLSLERNQVPLPDAAQTPNQEHVAEALEKDGPVDRLYDDVLRLDRPQAHIAFEQLSGSWAASVHASLLEDSRFLRQAVLDSAALEWAPGAAPGLAFKGTGVAASRPGSGPFAWGRVFYSSGDRAVKAGTPADERTVHGVVVGASRPLGPDWSAGAFFGGQNSRLRRSRGLADAGVEGVHAGLSLAGRGGRMRFAAGAAHTWNTIRSRRHLSAGGLQGFLSSRYDARTVQLFAEISPVPPRGAAPEAGTWLEPFARLAWVRTRTFGFSEEGGDAALDVLPASRSVFFSTLGLRLFHTIRTADGAAGVQARAGWVHAAGAVRSLGAQSFAGGMRQIVFESEGQPLARNAWLLELSATARRSNGLDLEIGYAGQFSAGRQDHGARLSLKKAF